MASSASVSTTDRSWRSWARSRSWARCTSASWCSPRLSWRSFSWLTNALRSSDGEQRSEALEEVAELLGVLPQVVEPLAGRVGGDGSTVGEDLLLGLLDPLRHDLPEVGRRARSPPRVGEPGSPPVEHGPALVALEHRRQLGVGGAPPVLDLAPAPSPDRGRRRGRAARRSHPSRRRRRRGRGRGRSAAPAPRTPPGTGRGRRRAARPCPARAPSGCAGPRPAGRAGTPRRCPRRCPAGSPRSCRRGWPGRAGSRPAPARWLRAAPWASSSDPRATGRWRAPPDRRGRRRRRRDRARGGGW